VSSAPASGSPQNIVIDASMALAWVFERQQPIDSDRANRLLAACGEVSWWIPGLCHLEVANALLVAERRSVLPRMESDRFLAHLNSLPITTDAQPTQERSARILALARGHGLSSYDATYLELAQRLGAALASFDRQLNRAASAIGVALFPETCL
jgi:predicted nucleic acid-binding protein